jgi:hypothetical protein
VLVFGCWFIKLCDLSQVEKYVVTTWENAHNDNYFTQNGWSCHFVNLSASNNGYFFSQLEISHVFLGPSAKNQHKCRTPSPCIMGIPLLQKFNNDIFI